MPEDYHPVAFELSVTGQAAEVSYVGLTPLQSLRVEAYYRSDDITPIAQATTDQLGNYKLVINTDGETPFDGYLKASAPGFVDTYLYLPEQLFDFYTDAPIRMVTADTLGLLDLSCAGAQRAGSGTIATIVTDYGKTPLAGATVASTPAANKYCYNGSDGLPDAAALSTSADGVAYMFNVIGPITASATMGKLAFRPRSVTARPDVLTVVLLRPY
jgi:hypothetical protein